MGKKIVLVIEDNPLNMKLITTLLHIGGHEALGADEAESGIRLAREKKPSLILMDVQLPGMDGLRATRVIKEDAELKHIPVIAVTSFAMPSDEKQAMEAGCAGYITKPIDTRTFLERISFFLDNDNSREGT